MEFGILNGEGMVDAYRQLRGSISHYYGFDSFEGLPALDATDEAASHLMPMFSKGNYKSIPMDMVKTSILGQTGAKPEMLTLTPGFFDQSLPKFDVESLKKNGDLHVVYIDCDLYSSTKTILEFIEPLVVDGTWLLLDDYWCYRGSPLHGQRLALEEFLKTSEIGVSDYTNFRGSGKAFICHRKNKG